MSHQGTIAAVLVKASLSRMDSWSALDDQAGVAEEIADRVAKNGRTRALDGFDLTAFALLKKTDQPALPITAPGADGPDNFSWKAAVMIWGGPVLTLACAYVWFCAPP